MLNVIKFKGCQRCGGDLFLERDGEEVYVSCLQCGAVYVKGAVYIKRLARESKEPKKLPVR